MKKILILILITALMLFSCKNNSTDASTSPDNNNSSNTGNNNNGENNNNVSTVTPEELEKYGIDIDTATTEKIKEALNQYYQDKGEYKLILKGTSTKTYNGRKNGDTIAGMVQNTKIKNVVVSSENVTFINNKIPDCLFGGEQNYNTSIAKIIIPDTITEIGKDAFDCHILTNLNIPKNLVTVRSNAIYGIQMKKLELPETLTYIDDRGFYASQEIEEIYIPDSVTYMGVSAFGSYIKVKKIHIPNNLEILNDTVFENSPLLENITIPASVKEIKKYAFHMAQSLTTVTFLSPTPPIIAKNAFNYCSNLKTINVPKGSKTLYEQLKGNGIPGGAKIIEN